MNIYQVAEKAGIVIKELVIGICELKSVPNVSDRVKNTL